MLRKSTPFLSPHQLKKHKKTSAIVSCRHLLFIPTQNRVIRPVACIPFPPILTCSSHHLLSASFKTGLFKLTFVPYPTQNRSILSIVCDYFCQVRSILSIVCDYFCQSRSILSIVCDYLRPR